jgi:GDP-4-dehydro-6-deoxy-D-mannose reductase
MEKNMKILITGIAGFVGHFLTAELLQAGHEVVGMDLSLDKCPNGVTDALCADLTNAESVTSAVCKLQPQACIHLGGIASPPIGRTNPELMLNTNILGTAHILEAMRLETPNAKILLASTSYIYGNSETEQPINEDYPLSPIGIYAVSKAACDMMTLAYARDYGMHTMTARAANHTGPGQSTDFVVPAFANQIKAISRGTQPPLMRVGNLDSERTFMDVRDVVRAYRLLIEKGNAGEAYNVATAKRAPIRVILDKLCKIAEVSPKIEIDEKLFRPTDLAPLLSAARIASVTGWQPEIPLEQTLFDILEKA